MGSDNNYVADATKVMRTLLVSLKQPQNIKFIVGVACLVKVLHILGDGANLTATSSQPPATAAYHRTVSSQTQPLQGNFTLECTQKLNTLDKVFDARRQARTDIVKQVQKSGKTDVYELLWKINVVDEKSKEREAKNKKAMSFDLFEPEAVCLTEERFGGESEQRFVAFGDGPKFVCGVDYLRESYAQHHHKPGENCLVYSVGSNNNILFERAVKQHIGCEIHTFDPTLQKPFVGSAYSTFHPWGLGKDGEKVKLKKPDVTFTTRSVENIMKELGHSQRKIDIFKMDCEWCEYEAMPPVFEAMARGQLQIDQILIEMHRVPYAELTKFFAAADKAGFRLTHKERNGWGCQGTGCVEYVFVSESFLRQSTAATIC